MHIVICVLVLGFIIRVIASYGSVGFLHGDAHFQYFEPAFYHIYGYGNLPWEFLPGETVRSWFSPGIIYGILSFFHSIKLEDSLIQLFIIRIILSLYTITGVYFIYLTLKELSDETAAKIGTIFAATWGFFVYFNIQTHGEMMAFPCIVISHYLILNTRKVPLRSFFSGIVFCFGFLLKFQICPMALSLLGYLLIKKEWKETLLWSAGFLLILFAHGFLDLAVYGKFSASVLRYGHLMLFTGHASSGGWGAQHTLSYVSFLAKIFSVLFPFVVIFFLYGLRRLDVISTSIIFYFIVHSLIPHKEIRYAAPMVPLLIIAATKGLREWQCHSLILKNYKVLIFKAVIVLFFISNVAQYAAPFVPSLLKPTRPPWLKRRDICLATHYVGQQENSKGVAFVHEDPPGLFYLHKNIPYAVIGDDKDRLRKAFEDINFNYIIFNTQGSALTKEEIDNILNYSSIKIKAVFNHILILEVA